MFKHTRLLALVLVVSILSTCQHEALARKVGNQFEPVFNVPEKPDCNECLQQKMKAPPGGRVIENLPEFGLPNIFKEHPNPPYFIMQPTSRPVVEPKGPGEWSQFPPSFTRPNPNPPEGGSFFDPRKLLPPKYEHGEGFGRKPTEPSGEGKPDWATFADMIQNEQKQREEQQRESFGKYFDLAPELLRYKQELYCSSQNIIRRKLGTKNGTYPSHLGVYSDSNQNDDNFLCSATWIDERFALTLASCAENIRIYHGQPTIRFGEWFYDSESPEKQSFVTRRVVGVHICPAYAKNPHEHNLAMLEFDSPVSFSPKFNDFAPACRDRLRGSMRMGSCWTPIRNVTMQTVFDPNGRGEWVEKKVVKMYDLEVKLIADYEYECPRRTGVYMGDQRFSHICSENYNAAQVRALLNSNNNLGAGIYCEEGYSLNLVSILHPIDPKSTKGYLDLSFFQSWITSVISKRSSN